MAEILILEDDYLLRTTLTSLLASQHYQVTALDSIKKVLTLLKQKKFDLLILDRLVKDGDSIELLAYLSEYFYSSRILMLTKKSVLDEKIATFNLGADDFLAKPFAKEEFLARVRSLLLKEKPYQTPYLQIAEFVAYPENGIVKYKNYQSRLRKREMEILAFLIRRRNRTVNREQIIDEVWGTRNKAPTYKTVDVYIRKIRVKLGPAARLIKTIRGFGYEVVEI